MAYRSYWFKRLESEMKKKSRHIRFKQVRYGFWRLYFKRAYLHELYGEMTQHGHDIEDYDPRLESLQYYQEYEIDGEIQRKLKNYTEGYWDSKLALERRLFMMRNNDAFYRRAERAYRQMLIK